MGIDLGTTNLVVAVLPPQGGTPVLFTHPTGMATTPSCLWKRPDERLRPGQTRYVVGLQAIGRQGSRPEPIRSIKSRMRWPIRLPVADAALPALAARIQANMGRTGAMEALGAEAVSGHAQQLADERFAAVRDAIAARTGAAPGSKLAPADLERHADVLAELGLVLVTDELMTPAEVSAHYLLETRRQIEQTVAAFGTDDEQWAVDRAIVTVPAYFDVTAKDATRRAAELAGLELVALLDEPTAAAHWHCWRTGTRNGTFLVYDFGGGTFDVSLLRVKDGHPMLLGLSGNTRLGGDQIDEAIAEYLRARLCEQGWALQLDLGNAEDRLRWQQLKVLAERVKKELSAGTTCTLRSDELRDQSGERVTVEMTFTRPPRPEWGRLSPIEQIIHDVTRRTIPYCDEALADALKKANVKLADVDAVILVGGSTHTPLVRDIVRNELCADPEPEYARALQAAAPEAYAMFAARTGRARGKEPVYQDADTAVALGAAVMAASAGDTITPVGADVRFRFSGAGLTDRTEGSGDGQVALINVAAVVERLTVGADGSRSWQPVGEAPVTVAAPDFNDDGQTDAQGGVTFRKVEVSSKVPSRVEVAVQDRARNRRVAAHVVVQFGKQVPPSPPPVTLSRTLRLEVNAGGRLVLDDLIPKLTLLPAEGRFDFLHPGSSEVEMPMFLNRRQIHVIRVPVPPMPRGTPIKMHVQIDKQSLITVVGTIGETAFDAAIEPPPPRGVPTAQEIAAVDEQYQKALEARPANERMAPAARWGQIRPTLDEALQAGDAEKAVDAFEELGEIAGDLDVPPVVLTPTVEEFEERWTSACDANREAEKECQKKRKPWDAAETERTIFALRDQGRAAAQRQDVQAWQQVNDKLVELLRRMYAELPQPSDDDFARHYLAEVQRMVPELLPQAAQKGRADLVKDLSALQAAIRPVLGKLAEDPAEARRQAAVMHEKVKEIASMLGSGIVEHPMRKRVERQSGAGA